MLKIYLTYRRCGLRPVEAYRAMLADVAQHAKWHGWSVV